MVVGNESFVRQEIIHIWHEIPVGDNSGLRTLAKG